MKILILNWRDNANPKAGGAEVVVHELIHRWVSWGHKIVLFTSTFSGGERVVKRKNLMIFRYGNDLSVRFFFWLYHRIFKNRFDIVIEAQTAGIPWFASFFLNTPILLLFHQTGRDYPNGSLNNSVLFYEIPKPLAILAFWLEPVLLKLSTRIPAIAVSFSTKQDLMKLGFYNKNVVVIRSGFSTPIILPEIRKSKVPTVISLGRLTGQKRVEESILAFYFIKKELTEAKMMIVGRGTPQYEKHLRNLVKKLGLKSAIAFYGFLSEEEKYNLLSKAHILLTTSIREGWGLVVIEANITLTIAVGYEVPGLRDSIINGETGLLVKRRDPKELAQAVIHIFKQPDKLEGMAKNARRYALSLSWDNAARSYLKVISLLLKTDE
ncbi:MAG: glycosyltransferase family 4 protein [Promethearchaeota archaeon]